MEKLIRLNRHLNNADKALFGYLFGLANISCAPLRATLFQRETLRICLASLAPLSGLKATSQVAKMIYSLTVVDTRHNLFSYCAVDYNLADFNSL